MIKILIADDHAIVRAGLKQLLKDIPDMSVEAEAEDGAEALRKMEEESFDVVLLDITMPVMNGLEVLKEMKKRKIDVPALILSIHPEEHYAIRSLKAGAHSYITKESAPDELIAAIRKVSSGRKYISESLAESLAFYLEDETDVDPHQKLSDREFQVFKMLASGKTVTEIAEELSLSVKTISTYRSRILQKMNMKTNSQLTRYALKNKIIK